MLERIGVVNIVFLLVLGTEVAFGVREGVGTIAERIVGGSPLDQSLPGHFESVIVLRGSPSELLGFPLVVFVEGDDLLDEFPGRLLPLLTQRFLLEVRKIKNLILEVCVRKAIRQPASEVSASHMGSGLNFSSQASRIL